MYKVSLHELNRGNFPLSHDCILKVVYNAGCPIRFEYFTCESQYSGRFCITLQSLSLVKSIEVISVDKFGL